MIKGLVFDLDGVITETAHLHFKSWQSELKELGIPYTEKENDKLKGLPRIKTLERILELRNKLNFSKSEKEDIASRKNEKYKKLLKTLTKKDVLPGIIDLLNSAKKHDLKLSIASSSYNASTILKNLDLEHYFDYVVYPGDIQNGKPAPDIFLEACKGIGINPHEAIGFEDALAGVQGLHDGKIFTIAITWGVEADWSNANLVYQSTNELNLELLLEKAN